MTIGTSIIERALQKIGAHSVISPASAESLAEGKDALNSMLEMWLSEGIDFGFAPLDAIGDDLDEPRDVTNGIVFNLAIWMAPDFDNGKVVVSQTLKGRAQASFYTIAQIYRVEVIPAKVVSSTLPRGAGHRQGFQDQIFFSQGDTISN